MGRFPRGFHTTSTAVCLAYHMGAAGGAREEDLAWEVFGDTTRIDPTIRTLIAEHDPISRHVLDRGLDSSGSIEIAGSVDSHRPLPDWPLRQIDVAVVGLSSEDPLVETIRHLSAKRIGVVLIGVDWTRRGVDVAVAAGAAGCLVKNTDLSGVIGAVHAVASGNRVLSPELLSFYIARSAADPRRHATRDAVDRLTDRERQVLALLGDGMSTMEVARKCGVSSVTIKSHVSHALAKLGARNRLEAVLMVKDALLPSS